MRSVTCRRLIELYEAVHVELGSQVYREHRIQRTAEHSQARRGREETGRGYTRSRPAAAAQSELKTSPQADVSAERTAACPFPSIYSPPSPFSTMQAIKLQRKYPEVSQEDMFDLINRFKSVPLLS
jgi:hypothetical protein